MSGSAESSTRQSNRLLLEELERLLAGRRRRDPEVVAADRLEDLLALARVGRRRATRSLTRRPTKSRMVSSNLVERLLVLERLGQDAEGPVAQRPGRAPRRSR